MKTNHKGLKSALSIFLSITFVLSVLTGWNSLFAATTNEDVRNATVNVEMMQVEYQTEPLGLDDEAPRFSWTLSSESRDVVQESYQILVADSQENLSSGPYVWNSGAEISSDTFGIIYNGSELSASTRYYWKVISTTNVGEAICEPSWWETGLMNDKIDGWNGAEWITKPGSAPDISDYTIDFEFSMVNHGATLRFASSGSYYLGWQFNINAVEGFGAVPYFRPHKWDPGAASMQNINISNIIPDTLEGKAAWYHCTIVVSKTGTNYIATTSLGPVGGDMTVIDNARTLPAGHEWTLGKIGFRQFNDSRNQDDAYFDNIVVTDNTGGVNNVIYTETFDGPDVPLMFDGHGSIENKTYRVGNGRHEDFDGSYRVVDSTQNPLDNGEPLFRKDFTVDSDVKIKSARLYATARGYYEFSINGAKVGEDYLSPGWTDYFYSLMYQTYDVTDMLVKGENVIGGMTGQGWYSGPMQLHTDAMYENTQSLLGRLVIEYEDGDTEEIVTDGSWKYHTGPIQYADNYAGEYYDARFDCEGWDSPDYDTTGWTPAGIHSELSSDVNIVSQTGEAIREVDRFSPKLTVLDSGRYIYDFGQNISGFVQIKAKGEAGQKIKLAHAEMLNTEFGYRNENGNRFGNGDGPIGTLYTESLRHQFSRGRRVGEDTYTFKGDEDGEEWMPRFTFHGFRYLEITGLDAPIPVDDIVAIAISSANELTTSFESSNSKVNQLYSNIIWGMHGNFVSVPTDCPNRDERLGYTGDTQIFAGTGVFLANTNKFYSKWLRDLRDYQLTEESGSNAGLVPVLIPAVRVGGFTQWSNAWGDAAVIVPWQLYQQYGDTQIIEESYESMKAWCDFLMSPLRTRDYVRFTLKEDGNPNSQWRDNNYGDWVALEGSDNDLTNSLFMAYDHKIFATMARAIGENGIADEYTEISENIVAAILARWSNEDGSLKITSQTPYALLLYFGLIDDVEVNENHAEALAKRISDNGGTLTTGFIGVNALVPSLSNNNQMEAAFGLLEQENYPSWIYSINQGATTTWERWDSYTEAKGFDGSGMNSFNHYAYGSIGEWMFSGALGIQREIENPGFTHFTLNPQYGGSMRYSKGHYDSVSGKIESGWEWNNDLGDFKYNFTVPANTSATILIPTTDPSSVRENGALWEDVEGVTYVGYDEGTQRAEFEVKSGSYEFTSKIEILPEYRNIEVKNDTLDVFGRVTAEQDGETHTSVTPAIIKLDDKKTFSLLVEPANKSDFALISLRDEDRNEVANPIELDTLDDDMSLMSSYAWVGQDNLVAGITPTATNSHNGGAAWEAGNLTDGRLTSRDGRPGWTSNVVGEYLNSGTTSITFNMGSEKSFNRIKLYPRTDATTTSGVAAGFPRDFKIEGSNDNLNWTLITSEEDVLTPFGTPYVMDFGSKNYQYVRLVPTRLGPAASDDGGGRNYRMQLTEFGIYNAELEELDVKLSYVGNKTMLAPQESKAGYTYYYEITPIEIPDVLPQLDSSIDDISNAVEYNDFVQVAKASDEPIHVLVYKVTNGRIVGYGAAMTETKDMYDIPVFTDGDGNILDALTGEILVTTLEHQNSSGEEESLTLCVAVYTPNGELKYVGSDKKVIADAETATFKVELAMPDNAVGYRARVFLWDSNTFSPVINKYDFK